MSYIRIELPTYKILKKELDANPNQIFHYMKYEGFYGDVKSVAFLNKKIAELKLKA